MSAPTFRLEGMEELRAALRALPADMTDEAKTIVESQALAAADDIKRSYPLGPTGKLRAGLSESTQAANRFGTVAMVKSGARHAHLFEFGTGQRRNSKGANRGKMPEGQLGERMIPIAVKRRRLMTQQLIELVRRAGFVVDVVE